MAERSFRWLFWVLALSGILLDQASKYGVFLWLPPAAGQTKGELTLVPDVFELVTQFTDVHEPGTGVGGFLRRLNGEVLPKVNHGAVFGANFNLSPETSNYLFALVSLVAAVAIVLWARRPAARSDRALLAALGLILGGTVGNLYDRLVFGGVRDFFHFHYNTFDWPVFNVADTCLVCGALLLLLQAFFGRPAPAEQAASDKSRQEMAHVP
jgi:lipoprotein signal peptidase